MEHSRTSARCASRRPAGGRAAGAVVCLLAWAGLAVAVCPSVSAATHEPDILDVRSDPDGGVRATATLHLPVPPALVQQVLTDYEGWSGLFGVPMRLARVDRQPDRVVTDVYVRHPILPGESRLLCENRELPDGGLVTKLIEGDFRRYLRTWRLAQEGNGTATQARFELAVDVKTWAPDWLVAIELKRQLQKHFRILRETVLARAKTR